LGRAIIEPVFLSRERNDARRASGKSPTPDRRSDQTMDSKHEAESRGAANQTKLSAQVASEEQVEGVAQFDEQAAINASLKGGG
jgi:hypothetical protein